MKVFNLAEELEKERKKNKELQKRIDNALNYIKEIFKEIEETKTGTMSINKLYEILKGGK